MNEVRYRILERLDENDQTIASFAVAYESNSEIFLSLPEWRTARLLHATSLESLDHHHIPPTTHPLRWHSVTQTWNTSSQGPFRPIHAMAEFDHSLQQSK